VPKQQTNPGKSAPPDTGRADVHFGNFMQPATGIRAKSTHGKEKWEACNLHQPLQKPGLVAAALQAAG
jgi:hypothetical protein